MLKIMSSAMTIQAPVRYRSQVLSPVADPVAEPVPHPEISQRMEALLTHWIDGILILTRYGEWVHSNPMARQICDRITQEQPAIGHVPKEIWRTCQVLIQSRRNYPNCPLVAESELRLKSQHHIRIRARWFDVDPQDKGIQSKHPKGNGPHILVILEDQSTSKQNLAMTEIDRYDLSSREADVWRLYRTDCSYQEIADKLHIAINTVKQHMKKIYAKRRLALVMDERHG